MEKPFSYETFLWICEHDEMFGIDETSFWFADDPNEQEHMFGCIRPSAQPYWVGDCDITDGCSYRTADELMNAPIFDGRSIKDRWEHLVFAAIGGIRLADWLEFYQGKF